MLKGYFDDLTADLNKESERVRRFFATHRPSAGTNREDLVAKLLSGHIVPNAGIETGLVLSSSGQFSNQSDILLVDRLSNTALHGHRPIPLWLAESVYAVIEVKTQLTPTEIKDSVEKCVRFKNLPTNFADSLQRQKISDSLFCIWAFEAPQPTTAKKNIEAALLNIPRALHPDFIVVPGSFLVRGGKYYELSSLGQPGSSQYAMKLSAAGGDPSKMLLEHFEMLDLGENTIFTFLYWLNSWLFCAGPRRPNLLAYYPLDDWGTRVP